MLTFSQFRITTAANVGEALHLIDTEPFDVLLSDLHMPGAADDFTVVSAMRHTNPDAVTLMYTGYLALKEAMSAILLQADEILLKPLAPPDLVAHPLPLDAHRQRVQRLVRAATGTEPVREALEVDLIDLVEDRYHGLLNDFVLQRCDAQRTLPSVSLRYKDSS